VNISDTLGGAAMAELLLVPPDCRVKLADYDPDDTGEYAKKAAAKAKIKHNVKRLQELQEVLWAEGKHALLVILQALDAGGKDGTIAHVMRGVNPQGCQVSSFKVPTEEELDHDCLWRVHTATLGFSTVPTMKMSS
jgi:polyphosphate kinase 2 (PPK2 family)